jgi:hypothetical protein
MQMPAGLKDVLTRVVREAGTWSAAQRRISTEHGGGVLALAAEIALRERGAGWLRGERPRWLRSTLGATRLSARE